MFISRSHYPSNMHTGAKVTLIIGGVFTVIGLIVSGLGVGAVATADNIEDNAELVGSSGSFTYGADDFGYEVFVKGEISSAECESITVTITNSTGETGDFWGSFFEPDCYDTTTYDYDGYSYIGYFSWLHDEGSYSLDASQEVIIYDTGAEIGQGLLGAGIVAFCGFPSIACGVLLLIIGGILALALKESQPVQMVMAPGAEQQPPEA